MTQWQVIPICPTYEVSDEGQVRHKRTQRLKKLQPSNCGGNYLSVQLWDTTTKRGKSYKVHWLVLLAFVGPKQDGMVIRHIDGNPLNNALTNLQYGTYSENAQDSLSHGTFCLGESHRSAKLTERKVRIIRGLRDLGYTQRRMAEMFGVSRSTIYGVLSGKYWAHVV